jgi:hypothetical protein
MSNPSTAIGINGLKSGLRIIHLHIPKTAGTSIRHALASVLPDGHCAPHIVDDEDAESYVGTDFSLYSGHFGFSSAEALGGDVITILRDPIDRCISTYLFWKRLYAEGYDTIFKYKLAHDYSLREFFKIQDNFVIFEEFFNRMTFQLCSSNTIEGRENLRRMAMTSSDIYAKAMSNLETFRLVGFQDDLVPFNAGLNQLVGRAVQIERINVTNKEPGPDYVLTCEERDAIERHLEMDTLLYHNARQRFAHSL